MSDMRPIDIGVANACIFRQRSMQRSSAREKIKLLWFWSNGLSQHLRSIGPIFALISSWMIYDEGDQNVLKYTLYLHVGQVGI